MSQGDASDTGTKVQTWAVGPAQANTAALQLHRDGGLADWTRGPLTG